MSIDLRVNYTEQDKQRLNRHMIGWAKVHAYICQLPVTEASLLELRKMLSIELDDLARPQVLTRLKGRFNSIRTPLEENDIFAKASVRMAAREKAEKKLAAMIKPVKAKVKRLPQNTAQLLLYEDDTRK